MQLPTVKIEAKNRSGHIIINKSDFDKSKDKLFEESIEESTEESTEEPVKEIVKESPTVINVGDKIVRPKKKPRGRPPLNKKEKPFD